MPRKRTRPGAHHRAEPREIVQCVKLDVPENSSRTRHPPHPRMAPVRPRPRGARFKFPQGALSPHERLLLAYARSLSLSELIAAWHEVDTSREVGTLMRALDYAMVERAGRPFDKAELVSQGNWGSPYAAALLAQDRT